MTEQPPCRDGEARQTASSDTQGDAHDLLIDALDTQARGDPDLAQTLIELALVREPANPAVLTGQAILYRKAGRLRDAVLACDKAIGFAPDYADAWLERGVILATGGSPARARESFARAAAVAPGNPAAHAGFATLAARDGALDEASTAAEKALALDPANLVAAGALAAIALERGEPDVAHELLASLVDDAPPGADRSHALSLLGEASERKGDHKAAFAYFSRANADFAVINSAVAPGQMSNLQFVEAIHEGLARTQASQWQPAPLPPSSGPNHIFLLGYPRSGTTLVENIMASLPGVAALEERPTLIDTDRQFLLGNPAEIADGVARFAALDATSLASLRSAYWSKVAACGVPRGAPHFIDMDPLKGTRLAFIARMFPAARIVVMRRDPRDVVWSCFKTAFAVASGTLEFTSLERAARHYDALMQLNELAFSRLPLAFYELRYESLIADFDGTTRSLCEFAGLPWDNALRHFDRTARSRGVATASAGQVRRGLYDGRRQWEPYARWIEPVMPILRPWVERFGYD